MRRAANYLTQVRVTLCYVFPFDILILHPILRDTAKPDVIIINEAAQATFLGDTSTALVPHPTVKTVMLVGDHCQNKPVLLQRQSNECVRIIENSLF